jgi:hypothetical protein
VERGSGATGGRGADGGLGGLTGRPAGRFGPAKFGPGNDGLGAGCGLGAGRGSDMTGGTAEAAGDAGRASADDADAGVGGAGVGGAGFGGVPPTAGPDRSRPA